MAPADHIMSAVNEALRRMLAEASDLTLNGLMRKAEAQGQTIGRATVARAKAGKLGPAAQEDTIVAIAELFGVDPRRLREVIGRPPGERGPWIPDHRSVSLTYRQRDALDRLIVTMVEGDTGAGDTDEKIAGRGEPGDELGERRTRREQPKRRTAARNAPSEKDRPEDTSGINQDPDGGMEPS